MTHCARYQTLRSTLTDELGIEPSSELRSARAPIARPRSRSARPGRRHREFPRPPQTQYAISGDLAIVYQVIGDGPIDVLVMPTGYSMMEPSWEWPALRGFWRRLAESAASSSSTSAAWASRIASLTSRRRRNDRRRARRGRRSRSARFALLGGSAGGATSALFAATYPERSSLVLLSPLLLGGGDAELPGWIDTEEAEAGMAWYLQNRWGSGESAELRFAPSLAGDARAREWVARMERLAGTPTSMAKVIQMNRGSTFGPRSPRSQRRPW